MNSEITNLLAKNGYKIYVRSELMVITRHSFRSTLQYLVFLPGLLMVIAGLFLHQWIHPVFSLMFLTSGVIATSIPFFKYLISAYRSLIIDFESQTLLFRSSYSRAHRFCDIEDIKTEFDNSNGTSRFLIVLYFDQQKKEELFELKMMDNDIDRRIFDIKDYFEARLKPVSSQTIK